MFPGTLDSTEACLWRLRSDFHAALWIRSQCWSQDCRLVYSQLTSPYASRELILATNGIHRGCVCPCGEIQDNSQWIQWKIRVYARCYLPVQAHLMRSLHGRKQTGFDFRPAFFGSMALSLSAAFCLILLELQKLHIMHQRFYDLLFFSSMEGMSYPWHN